MEVKYEYVTEASRLKEILPSLFKYPILAVDCETRGLSPFERYTLRSIQISTSHDFTYVINAALVDPRPLKHLLQNPNTVILAHNAKFDYKILKQCCGITLTNIFDSMIAERLITCGLTVKNSLYDVVQKYLGQTLDKTVRKGFIGSIELELSREEQEYAARDTQVLFLLYEPLTRTLKAQGLWPTAALENGCVTAVGDIELAGCLIDVPKWQALIDANTIEHIRLTQELNAMASMVTERDVISLFGEHTSGINFKSSQQLLELFDALEIDANDTKEATLVKINDPFVKKLLEYKGKEKQLSSFGQKFFDLIEPSTGRIHPSLNQLGADSGRFSSNNPNLQQIPQESEFRSCFVARNGYKIITADYSGQELRVLAQLSGEPTFVNAFNNNEDLHAATASAIFNIPINEVSKVQRSSAKTCNFALAYGAGPAKIASQLEISEEEGKSLFNKFYKANPKLKIWLDQASKDAIKNRYSTTPIGRKRYFRLPDKESPDYRMLIGSIERQGKNAPIQGASVDMIKMALIGISSALKYYDARAINVVHDEIVVEAREDIAGEVAKMVEYEMVQAGMKIIDKIPVLADIHVENYWSKG